MKYVDYPKEMLMMTVEVERNVENDRSIQVLMLMNDQMCYDGIVVVLFHSEKKD
jgi:hypothetical protein